MSETAKFANVFTPVFQKAAETAAVEKQRAQEKITELHEQRKRIDEEVMELEAHLEKIDQDIAIALKHAASDAGFRLDIGGTGGSRRSRSATGPEAFDGQMTTVLAAVSQDEAKAMTAGEISKEANLDGITTSAALKKLLATGKINHVGARRSKKYFKIS